MDCITATNSALSARTTAIDDPAPQTPIESPAFDTWREPGGTTVATFHRIDGAILVRFPGTADFRIAPQSGAVQAIPASAGEIAATRILLANSIAPLVANHAGGTNLHGSAASIDGRAAAFLGVSRRGKSTLAGVFARAGHPCLTEDVLALRGGQSGWEVAPDPGDLRLYPDSARFMGVADPLPGKSPLTDAALLRADAPMPLGVIYLLGDGKAERVSIESVGSADALGELLRHAFILDVEDRARLAAHFGRLADLAAAVRCRRLDYPRRYALLPEVVAAVVDDLAQT